MHIKTLVCSVCTSFLVLAGFHFSAQQVAGQPPALNQHATFQETLGWLNTYWFPFAGIGIDDRRNPANGKTNVGFFKGFRLVSSDKCTLVFRNEGEYKNASRTSYLVEAKIPITDLTSNHAQVLERKPFSSSMDELYGLFDAQFTSRSYDLTITIDFKKPDDRSYSGSIVKFSLPTKEGATIFSKAFLHLIRTCK